MMGYSVLRQTVFTSQDEFNRRQPTFRAIAASRRWPPLETPAQLTPRERLLSAEEEGYVSKVTEVCQCNRSTALAALQQNSWSTSAAVNILTSSRQFTHYS